MTVRNFLLFVNIVLIACMAGLGIQILFGSGVETLELPSEVPAAETGPVMLPDVKAELDAAAAKIAERTLFLSSRGVTAAPQVYSTQKPGIQLIGILTFGEERQAIIIPNGFNVKEQKARQLYSVGNQVPVPGWGDNNKVFLKEIKDNSIVLQLTDGLLEMSIVRDQITKDRGINVNLVQ